MLVVRLKEEKKREEEPDWKWTLVYTGKKRKSIKLHYCMSSLHPLICLRETWPGGCGLLNLKLLRFMQFSFSVPSVVPQARPSEPGTSRCLPAAEGWVQALPSPPAPAGRVYTCTTLPAADERHCKATLVSWKTCSFLSAVPTLPLEHWFQRTKGGKNAPVNKPAPFSGRGVGPNLSLHTLECHAARQS